METRNPTPQILKRAIIYCRVSTKEQADEGGSLKLQEKICRDYASKNNIEITDVYIERGESAKTADRTELIKLINFCTSNKKSNIQTILFYKLDRFSRNQTDYGQLKIMFKKYGLELRSATELFDDTPTGRFLENT